MLVPQIQIRAQVGKWDLKLGHQQRKSRKSRGEEPPVYDIEDIADRIVSLSKGLFRVFAAVISIHLVHHWETLKWNSMSKSAVLGTIVGMMVTRKYHNNRRSRYERKMMYRVMEEEEDQLVKVLIKQAYWASRETSEQQEFLSKLLRNVWKHYDTAVCNQVKEQIGPLLQKNKPVFLSSIELMNFSLGLNSPKVNYMKVENSDNDEEIIIRGEMEWHGEPQIILLVTFPVGSYMTVHIRHITCKGQFKLILGPMKDQIPGFAGLSFSLEIPPSLVLDVVLNGTPPGVQSGVLSTLQTWVQPFVLYTVLRKMLIWPMRIFVPMGELTKEEVEKYDANNCGILHIIVHECSELRADKSKYATAALVFTLLPAVPVKFTLPVGQKQSTPQDKWFFVKEEDQYLYMALSKPEYAYESRLNEFLYEDLQSGRAFVKIQDLEDGQYIDKEIDFGLGSFRDEGGTGVGEGKVKAEIAYVSMETLQKGWRRRSATVEKPVVHRGILLVKVVKATGVWNNTDEPHESYTIVKVEKEQNQTGTVTVNNDPVWNEEFEYFYVSVQQNLVVEVFDEGGIFSGKFIQQQSMAGRVSIPLVDIAAMPRMEKFRESYFLSALDIVQFGSVKKGKVFLEMTWIPLDDIPIGRAMITSKRGSLGVLIMKADALVSSDWFDKKPDAQVVLHFNDVTRRTDMIDEEPFPEWFEEFWWDKMYPIGELSMEIMDKGLVDSTLGVITINVNLVATTPGNIQTRTVHVGDADSGQGTLQFQIVWMDGTQDQEDPRVTWPLMRKPKERRRKVVNALDWPSMADILEEVSTKHKQ
eukprot:TRINITY_DN23141_c0_g1_i11.p1 TRINITY_DN23141_c0_g1~~TRINITY_DN23141_c0_g1_i11.p1  ORF type:complete len:810 (-),score=125.22 TRINITY_DN23141_c0_g1_i11:2021-4450(-)